jgi:hypothetical protein
VRPIQPKGLPTVEPLRVQGNATIHVTLDGHKPLCNAAHFRPVEVLTGPWPVTCQSCYDRATYVEDRIGRVLATTRQTTTVRSTGRVR